MNKYRLFLQGCAIALLVACVVSYQLGYPLWLTTILAFVAGVLGGVAERD